MIWDPVKPFKCECPRNYGGELCEKCKKNVKYQRPFLRKV